MRDYHHWQWLLLRHAQRRNHGYVWFDEEGMERMGVTIARFR